MSYRYKSDDTQLRRKQKLASLVEERANRIGRGAQAALANELGIAPSYLTQLLNTSGDRKKSRPIKEDTAREFESKLGKDQGWFDEEEDAQQSSQAQELRGDFSIHTPESRMAVIARIAEKAEPLDLMTYAELLISKAKSRLLEK